MSKRKPINPDLIREIDDLKSKYEVVFWTDGTWLVEDWLFIYPRNCKWGDRYRQAWGYYTAGKLEQFVDNAMQNKLTGHYAGDKTIGTSKDELHLSK